MNKQSMILCPFCDRFRRKAVTILPKSSIRIHIKKSHGNNMLEDFNKMMNDAEGKIV